MQKIDYFLLVSGVLLFTATLMDSLKEWFFSSVTYHFVDPVENFGLPGRVRRDHGVEDVDVAR